MAFLAGFTFATRFFSQQPEWMNLLIAFGCGIIGILLAIFLQRIAVAVAGFLAGGLFATRLLTLTGWQLDPAIAYIICGILGALLISFLFEWALIFFSSLTGAMLITRSINLEPVIESILILVLVVFGIVIQTRIRPRTAAAKP